MAMPAKGRIASDFRKPFLFIVKQADLCLLFQQLDVNIKFDFLEKGNYKSAICKDGVNADRYAADYILMNTTLKKNDEIKVHLAPGGGFLISLEKK